MKGSFVQNLSLLISSTKAVNLFVFQWLYRLAVEEVPELDYMLPLSEAEVTAACFCSNKNPESEFKIASAKLR